jgi:hypothetical protein
MSGVFIAWWRFLFYNGLTDRNKENNHATSCQKPDMRLRGHVFIRLLRE